MKPSTTLIPPPIDDGEKDKIIKATFLSLTIHKTILAAEAQENVAKVQEKIMEEDNKKMVDEAEEESYASEFADSVFQDDANDSGNRIEPESHKEHPKTIDDGDENENENKDDDENEKKNDDDKKGDNNNDHTHHTLVKEQVTDSLVIRKEKTQTPISLP
nr:hypothetical protein [Tanacetum cinerariifolium]